MSMIVNQVVDRCHVSETNLQVIRYVRSRMSRKGRSKGNWKVRKEIYAQAIKRHAENRDVYHQVMSGRLWSRG